VTPAAALLAALAFGPAPAEPTTPAETAAPTERTAPEPVDDATAVEPADDDANAEPGTEPDPESVDDVATEPEAESEPEPEIPSEEPSGTLRVASERAGPPYAREEDLRQLRARYKVETDPPAPRKAARWRCLIADPTCRTTFEVVATAAYAMRFRQGDVRVAGAQRWHSGRAQYDFWLNFPALVEQEGTAKYTKMHLGPKGGVVFSDTGDMWGNFGVGGRYWLGKGRWAPTIEFSSALSFKLGHRAVKNLPPGTDPKFEMQRGPVGFTADVGVGIGGFGALVIGGQYDSPLAREDVPERFRTSAAGMFFVGLRGNILWGGPAAAGILTHGLTQRLVEAP
jgi:hypothetical protein